MAALERYSRSFYDALSLARNIRDQATIYYRQDETRAVYDVVTERSAKYVNTGTLIINGRCLAAKDVPLSFRDGLPSDGDPESLVMVVKQARVAKELFEHMGVSSQTGWDLRP